MATSSFNEDKSIASEQESNGMNRSEDKDDIIVICFDPNNDLNDNIDHFKIRLHQISDHVVFHTELESCISFIQSIENREITRHAMQGGDKGQQYGFSSHFWYIWSQISKVGALCKRISKSDETLLPTQPPSVTPLTNNAKIFLVISKSSISPTLVHITALLQIVYVFIFCLENDQYDYSLVQHSKIIGIYDKVDSLCSAIEEQIDLVVKQFLTWTLFDQHKYATKDLSKQSSDFLWLQLVHDALLHLSRDEQAKKQMIDAWRHYYRDNRKELQLIDEFEHEYQSKDAINWYLKSSFLRKMINKALQIQDTDQLYTLRYFLGDLVENLSREHQHFIQSEKEILVVYQEMKLSRGELNKLKENKGKLISMKAFLTASRVRSSALTLDKNSAKRDDLIIARFEIECDIQELNGSVIFADIARSDESPYQEDILFDFNSTFRLENIHQNEQIWIIKMTAVSDGRIITQKYIDDTHRQIEDLSISIIFGKLLCDMSLWDESQKYFEHLLNDSHNEDLAWIEHSIGFVHHWKGEWNEARKYYDRAYDRMMQVEPVRTKDSALVLSDISVILFCEGKFEDSYDFIQRALTIRKKYYSPSHLHIATCLENNASIHSQQDRDDEALVFLQQALAIREEYFHYIHIDVALNLIKIGLILASQEKCDEALDYSRRAVSMLEKYYPSGNVITAWSLNVIGYVLYRQEKYDEAFDIVQRALKMLKKFYPSGHIDIASSLSYLGNIKNGQGKYDEALDFHQQVLSIEMKYYSSSHIAIAGTLNSMGNIQSSGKENFDEALQLHQQALTMLKTYYPSYYGHIAVSLSFIGHTLNRQGKYNEALDSYKQALVMQQSYYPSDNVNIAYSLKSIGNVLGTLGKNDEAFEYYEKALRIQRKCYQSDNVQIANSFNDMAVIRESEGKYDEAMDFYQQAVAICEKYSPSCQASTAIILGNIGRTLNKQKKYDEAFKYQQRALNIQETHFPSHYMNIANSFNYMGSIRYGQRQYGAAIDFYQRALVIYEKNSLPGHVEIPKNLMSIGYIRFEQRKLDEAIDYYQLALTTLEEYHSTDHINIVWSLGMIASLWNAKQCYDHAIKYYEKCLRIKEGSLTPEHSFIASDLSKLSQVHYSRQQYELSLAYELKCFSMREKTLPPDHLNIGCSLSNIGDCYELLNKRSLALDYYKRALAVYEQCLPDSHENRRAIESKIERLSEV